MDPEAGSSDGVVAHKRRPAENGGSGELGERSPKRPRSGPRDSMRRVAEIVLVLAGMAEVRGGRKPTEVEAELMAEARAKLAGICQDFAPKDLLARDAVDGVIEDLGLNWKVKDQRLGFRPTRLSIKEKFDFSKRKMEESKKFAAPSASFTSQTSQPSFAAPLHTNRTTPSDKPNTAPLPSGSSPLGHVSAATSTSVAHQPPTSELKVSSVSSGLPSSHLGSSSASGIPKVEKTQLKLEGGPQVTPHVPLPQASTSTNQQMVNTPAWAMQPHSFSPTKPVPNNKVPNHNPAKVDGSANLGMSRAVPQAARDQMFRPFVAQTTSANFPSIHQPMQGAQYIQPSSYTNTHNDIAKIVQKLLQPKISERPTWTPPSRDYMNKVLICQMCKLTVNEVETVVLCDSCEKGYHLKCLETLNQKGIPRGEWHCTKCMALSNGKPLPPKYGRVMRSITPPKVPSNPSGAPSGAAGAQSASEKKMGSVEPKVNPDKITVNGSSSLLSHAGSGSSGAGGNNILSSSDPRIAGTTITAGGKDVDKVKGAGTSANETAKSLGAVSDSPGGILAERCTQQTQATESPKVMDKLVSELKVQSPTTLFRKSNQESENSKPLEKSDSVRIESSSTTEVPLKTIQEVEMSEDAEGNSNSNTRVRVKQNEEDGSLANPVRSSGPDDGAGKQSELSSDSLRNVEWIGNVLKVVDGKTHYESFCIDRVTYKLQDHALFHSSPDRLIPSKLKAMWEDTRTGLKWVIADRCYFPGDLPEGVGRPCAPESSEVYESNHELVVMAGLIQGPCKVLPPTKFKERSEGSQSGTVAEDRAGPVFLCKWFYDETKGSFQPVFS